MGVSGNTDSAHHQTAVVQGVFTGRQADQLVAVNRGNAGVVEGQLLTGGNKLIELLFIGRIHELVIAEALTNVGGRLENSKNLETVEITELNTDTKTYQEFKELFTSGKSGISNINIVYQRYEGLVTITYDQTDSKGKVTKGIIENFEIKTGIADNNAILKMIVEAIVAEAEAEI